LPQDSMGAPLRGHFGTLRLPTVENRRRKLVYFALLRWRLRDRAGTA
jgi:hypothetical protein